MRVLLQPQPQPLNKGIIGVVWSCVHCSESGKCFVCNGWGFTGDPIGINGDILNNSGVQDEQDRPSSDP